MFEVPGVPYDAIVYVNGRYCAAGEAAISPFDRGFLFADGVYEVSAVLDGRLVDNGAHFARLERSLAEMNLPRPASDAELEAIQRTLIARNAVDEGLVYLQITRGAARRDFAMRADVRPTLFAFAERRAVAATPGAEHGLSVAVAPDLRWKRCDVKTIGLLGASMAKTQALAAGFDDVWMVDDAGRITEASSSNAAIVTSDGAVSTRPLGREILPGITRAAVAALVEGDPDLFLVERPFTVAEAQAATEAFQTGASSFVQPVTRIDGAPIGDGRPGPRTRRLQTLYLDFARAGAT